MCLALKWCRKIVAHICQIMTYISQFYGRKSFFLCALNCNNKNDLDRSYTRSQFKGWWKRKTHYTEWNHGIYFLFTYWLRFPICTNFCSCYKLVLVEGLIMSMDDIVHNHHHRDQGRGKVQRHAPWHKEKTTCPHNNGPTFISSFLFPHMRSNLATAQAISALW